jgi:DNA-binding NarL/FixJ family response regulator
MIRILLVDDQNLVQQGIKSLLAQDPDLEIVGTLKDGRSAVTMIAELCPDIVLLDIEMPGMDGITATKYITRLAPDTKVIILSSHEDKKYLTQALMAGARAYLLKDSLIADLKQSIIAVNNGYSQIESRLLAKIFDPSNLRQSKSNRRKTNHRSKQAARSPNSAIPVAVNETNTSREKSLMVAEQVTEDRVFDNNVTDASDVSGSVVLSQTESNDHDAYLESPPPVPKINLPDSELEYFAPLPSVKNIDVAEDVTKSGEITTNGLLPTAVVQHSALQLSTTEPSLMVITKSKNYRQQIARYKTKLTQIWASKMLQYEPLINRCHSQLIQYKSRLLPLLKRWHEKGWLTNAGLAFLGLITVIIIGQMFS